MFFVTCSHNEDCEATLQIVNGLVKSLEGGFTRMASSIFWAQGSDKNVRGIQRSVMLSLLTQPLI